jgi:undecaprenyl-diphosphatase
MTYFEAFIIALVEGLTEFLPVSSTGHMILASAALGLKSSPFLNLFIISIQFGAILSVLFLYWKRFFVSLEFYFKIAYALIPTVIIAFLLKKYVDQALGSVLIVGINLLIGGFIMLYLESYFKKKTNNDNDLKPLNYGFIGLFQAISIFPGVSRSAATIYGGMFQGMTRKDAAEFSFVLAVPIMFLASAKDLYDFLKLGKQSISNQEITVLVFGNVVAFLVAILAIKFFVSYIVKYGFTMFAYYRILVGILVIVLYKYFGFTLQMM